MPEANIPDEQPREDRREIEETKQSKHSPWLYALLLVGVLLAGAYLRISGLYWGEFQYLHPDERFLVWVGSDIQTVDSLAAYFDTAVSPLNPNNAGHGFYVYGTLPMFLTRYMVEWIYGHSGFAEMTRVGRALSTFSDLLTVLLVYLVAARLYNRRLAILAAAFSSAAVLQIQQSHFFTMDTFINFFSFLAFYFAVQAMVEPRAWQSNKEHNLEPALEAPTNAEGEAPSQLSAEGGQETGSGDVSAYTLRLIRSPLFLTSVFFGAALGMAVASKLNAALMAVALPVALGISLLNLPKDQRRRHILPAFAYLVTAAVISLIVFRIFQPYAFSGPGFFGLKINPQWESNIRELLAQSSGEVDFPPAMQWARRPVWFSWQNLTLWGLGLPLGILAWTGFLWIAWRMIRVPQEWRRHALIWGWTAAYFTWQSLALNPTMRYQLPIYPTLAIFAAWAVIALYDRQRAVIINGARKAKRPSRSAAILVGVIALIATFGYAYGFSRIYVRPITRVEATRWIYQNIPGPITLPIESIEGVYNQPLPVPYSLKITPGIPFSTVFIPKTSGDLSEIILPRVLDESGIAMPRRMILTLHDGLANQPPIASTTLEDTLADAPRGKGYTLALDHNIRLEEGKTYALRIELLGEETSGALDGLLTLGIQANQDGSGWSEQQVDAPARIIYPNDPYQIDFIPISGGMLEMIYLTSTGISDPSVLPNSVRILLGAPGEQTESQRSDLTIETNPTGDGFVLIPDQPLALISGERHVLSLEMKPEGGLISLQGLGIANEGEWDDGLPLRMDGYDGFGGIYPLDLNFNMYWDDNPDKLARFTRILDSADYVVITSSRQWGSLPRLPERFPLTTTYYRNLLGCPPTQVIEFCYNIAKPGMYQGKLGYELVEVFQSDPAIGPLRVNDQFSEEAFTVYDHPKVFIFKKQATYDGQQVRAILGAVNFSEMVRVKPMLAAPHPENLLLPDHRLAEQQGNGDWSTLFDTQALHNKYQALSVVVWYLSVTLLGLLIYPLLRSALPGLADRGYPMARLAGMLLLSYLVWLAGSARIPFSRLTISLMLALIACVSGVIVFKQRSELRREFLSQRRYFLVVEALSLAFFLAFLLVRIGNPDLWHPWKGGERPMDFSYFNAVLKSTSFPPYDPWYAGGYLNYYYYGFVLVAVLVKWLGLVPSIAYNLVLPTIFSMIALGAFSLVWNLSVRKRGTDHPEPTAYLPAIAGALGMAVVGNLGTVRMIFQGYQRLAAPGGVIEGAGLFTRWGWAFEGFIAVLKGANLPYSLGDWYWIPSRAIPAPGDIEPITEFPYFSLLYGDLHAHLMALPITLLALAFPLSIVLGRARFKSLWSGMAGFILGGLAIGALRPTNTWDFYPYLALGCVAVGYALWRNFQAPQEGDDEPERSPNLHPGLYKFLLSTGALSVIIGGAWVMKSLPGLLIETFTKITDSLNAGGIPQTWASNIWLLGAIPLGMAVWSRTRTKQRPQNLYFLDRVPASLQRVLVSLGGMSLLVILAFITFQPFAQWYALGYTRINVWTGTHTPPSSYLVHWGLFLFLIVSWMIWESREWMANTPLSALNKLRPHLALISGLLVAVILALIGLASLGVRVGWFVLPLAAWAGLLLLRPGASEAQRTVLFLVGTALTLTLMVEVIVLVGDIGRMNTVFKFYLQAWTLLAISAATALGWLAKVIDRWLLGWQRVWYSLFIVLVAGAALFPLLGSTAKIKDRIADEAPYTLDGMAFMPYAQYADEWGVMQLDQDYHAIRWLQENVENSPVIVEANLRALYRWGSRMTIYTGLPGVVGWEWHQQQQRGAASGAWVSARITEVDNFYLTTDWDLAADFLRKYNVRYIILGQQERGHYPGPGLEKFEQADGVLWHKVYHEGDTVIYFVAP